MMTLKGFAVWGSMIAVIFRYSIYASTIIVPNDYSTIQQGINASQSGDTVLVENGTYYENINFHGKNIVVASRYVIDYNVSHISNTIIDGSMSAIIDSGSCVVFNSGEDSSAVIQGFTLTGGTGTSYDFGGAVYREGGGILTSYSSPSIKNNLIIDNVCEIVPGVLGGGGGGISIIFGNAYILNNIIMSNSASYAAGLVLNWSGGVIRNNIVYQNTGGGQYGTAGIMVWESTPWSATIENNTIIGNVSTSTAGGLSVTNSSAYIRNNIIWGNRQQTGQQVTGFQTSVFEYCNTEEIYPGQGNISVNPDIDSTHFLLLSSSPCIDAGNPNAIFNDLEDANNPGNALYPSVGNLRNDIGAYGGPGASILPEFSTYTGFDPQTTKKLPNSIILNQNYPNPFNPNTTISFQISKPVNVRITIFDTRGQLVETMLDNFKKAGFHSIQWDASAFSSGLYYYKINAGKYADTKKCLYLK